MVKDGGEAPAITQGTRQRPRADRIINIVITSGRTETVIGDAQDSEQKRDLRVS